MVTIKEQYVERVPIGQKYHYNCSYAGAVPEKN